MATKKTTTATKKSTTATKAKSTAKRKATSSAKKSAANIISENTTLSSSQSKKAVSILSKAERKLHPVTFIVLIVCLLIGFAAGYFIASNFIFKSACDVLLGGIS